MDGIENEENLNFLKLDNKLRRHIYNTLKKMFNISYVSEDLTSKYDNFDINIINKQSVYNFSEGCNQDLRDVVLKKLLEGSMKNFKNNEQRAILLCKSFDISDDEIGSLNQQTIKRLVNFGNSDIDILKNNAVNLVRLFHNLFGLYFTRVYQQNIEESITRDTEYTELHLPQIFNDYFNITNTNNNIQETNLKLPSVSELLKINYVLTPTINPKEHLIIRDKKIYCYALNRLFIFYNFTRFGEIFGTRDLLIEILNTYFLMVNNSKDFEYLKEDKILCKEIGDIDAFICLKHAQNIDTFRYFNSRIRDIQDRTINDIEAMKKIDYTKFINYPAFIIFQVSVLLATLATAIGTLVLAIKSK